MTMIEKIAKRIYDKRNGYGCKEWSSETRSIKDSLIASVRHELQQMRCSLRPLRFSLSDPKRADEFDGFIQTILNEKP